MIVYITFALFGLFSQYFFFAPLFLLVYFYLFHPRLVFWLAIMLGLLGDLFWVYPLGFSSFLFLLFLLLLYLYSQKFNHLNQLFLLLLLLVSSGIILKIANLELNSWHIFSFACLFVYLSIHLRKARKYSFNFLG